MSNASMPVTATTSPRRCQFPGCTCPVPERVPGRPGAPRRYCDHPDHTAQKALRRLRAAAEVAVVQPLSRPVTGGTHTLAGLLDRYSDLRDDLTAVAGEVADVIAHLTDPSAIDREIAEIQRQAEHRIVLAERARSEAEWARAAMAQRLNRAVEVERLALTTAREARAVTIEADQRVTAAETDAAARVADAELERDRIRGEADAEVARMRSALTEARRAQGRAEGERDLLAIDRQALLIEVAELKRLLDTIRTEHRNALEARDIEYARALTAAFVLASRTAREHREQLAAVFRSRELADVVVCRDG